MSSFVEFFSLGKNHILDIYSVDHILFIIALCAVYLIRDWRKVLILVLCFAFGHSVTLALSSFQVINIRQDLVQYLIPVTIFVTAVSNVFKKQNTYYKKSLQSNYFLAAFFGLIHGLGFSYYLINSINQAKPKVVPLIAYNLGIEFGLIIIVILFLITSYLFINIININRRDWNLVISSAIAGIAITLMFESRYWV